MKYFSIIVIYITLFSQHAFADTGILWGEWITKDHIRSGNLHLDDIWKILKHAIDWMMWFAWTVAVIAIIIGAYKILFGSVSEWDTKKWKEYVSGALLWFALAALGWFIVKLIIDNFS